jgi:hypothetical protein
MKRTLVLALAFGLVASLAGCGPRSGRRFAGGAMRMREALTAGAPSPVVSTLLPAGEQERPHRDRQPQSGYPRGAPASRQGIRRAPQCAGRQG